MLSQFIKENLNINDTSKTISTIYRCEKSLNGFSVDVLKSALQKYIRRGNVDMAIYAGIELDLFQYEEGGNRIYTNLIHRLMIIYLEDIGLSAFTIWKDLDIMFDKLLLKDSKKEIKTEILINIINILSLNSHSRIGSHFNSICTFKNNEKIIKYLENFPEITEIYSQINNEELDLDLESSENLKKLYTESLKNKNKSCFYWAKKIDDSSIFKPSEKRKIIFQTFLSIVKQEKISEYIKIGEKWYKEIDNLKERFLTYFMPLLVWIFNKKKDGNIFKITNWKDYLVKNIKDKTLIFDDFIYDMHTKKGKKNGKSAIDFIKEGSIVINEDIFFEEIKRFYDFSKLLVNSVLDEKLIHNNTTNNEKFCKESELFEFILRAQLVTSQYKTDTYYAKDKRNGKIVFVKGPFKDKNSLRSLRFNYKLRKLLKLKVINFELIKLIEANHLNQSCYP
jgi:hypothetical protein